MLKEKKGDLIKAALSGEVNVIAHQCNCFNNMKSGIAPQIAKAFPEAEWVDKQTRKGDKDKLGKLSMAFQHNTLVFNLYGQYSYGKGLHTNYEALRGSLRNMRHKLISSNMDDLKIGLPLIGCGLGGGDWGTVSKIIEEELSGFDVTIYRL